MTPAGGSRDQGWLLVGAAATATVVAVAVLLGAGDEEGPSYGRGIGTSARPGPSASVTMHDLPVGALLPNLRVLPAEELDITGRGRRVLRFASVLTNDGNGPLQVSPVPDEVCPPDQRYVEQRIYIDADSDDTFDRRRDRGIAALPGGCMLFHPRHEHWHFDSTAGCALTAVVDDAPIVARSKVSFCLRDSEPVKGAIVRHRRSYADCARDRRQGITVGWADRYDATLAGQRLALPQGFVDGVYCLRLEVDPFDLLREADEEDNTSAVVVRIAGRVVGRDSALTC